MDLSSEPPLAKVSRPHLPQVYPRHRLFKKLDEARANPIVWIEAPPGSGKTTLVANYADQLKLRCLWYQADEGDGDIASFFYYMRLLLPASNESLPLLSAEYLTNLPTFTRNFFRNFYSQVPTPGIIVIDNYQDVPADGPFHQLMEYGLAEIPRGLNVFIISRNKRPSSFARFSANGMVYSLCWNDIRLTQEECAEICYLHKQHEDDAEQTITRIYEQTEGWVAGLVLLLEQSQDQQIDKTFHAHQDLSLLFDYFANEVFRKSDADLREFLVSTSFLPKFTVTMAEQLTNNSAAGQILFDLNRRNYFTLQHIDQDETYEYHPLFREFLQHRAKTLLATEAMQKLYHRAARLLANSNHCADAARLLIESEQWSDLISLLDKHSTQMLEQGRFKTVAKWIEALPKSLVRDNPKLSLLLGHCWQVHDISASRQHFVDAYHLYKESNDFAGLCSAWAGIVDSYIYEWVDMKPLDHWIQEIASQIDPSSTFPSVEIEAKVSAGMLKALMHRQPNHSAIGHWCERLEQLILFDQLDPTLRILAGNHLLLYHSWWTGNFTKASSIFENLRDIACTSAMSAFTQIVWLAIQANYLRLSGDIDACLDAVNEALEQAQQSGLHLWDFFLHGQGVWASLANEDLVGAQAFLHKAKLTLQDNRHLDIGHFHFISFSCAMHKNDIGEMQKHAQLGLEKLTYGGAPTGEAYLRCCQARVLHARAQTRQAIKLFQEVIYDARGFGSAIIEYHALLGIIETKITLALPANKIPELQQFFLLAKQKQIMNCSAWRNSVMSKICAMALQQDIETDFVKKLIRLRKLTPPEEFADPALWPWPIEIRTFGEFTLHVDGKLIKSGSKSIGKPLLLLKALIAYGGRAVKQEKLCDTLWPDADGDAAYHTFETTLYRLRKLLEHENALILQAGQLSINPNYCWLDLWSFQQLLNQLEQHKPTPNDAALTKLLTHQLTQLERGPFLSALSETSWLIPIQQQLAKRWRNALELLRNLRE